MNERSFQALWARRLRDQGYLTQTYNLLNQIGHPDLLISDGTHAAWVELKLVKIPKRRDTPLQLHISGPQVNWANKWADKPIPFIFLIGLKDASDKYTGWFMIKHPTFPNTIKVTMTMLSESGAYRPGYPLFRDVVLIPD